MIAKLGAILMSSTILVSSATADVILSGGAKYGPNGYNASGNSYSSSETTMTTHGHGHGKTTSTSSSESGSNVDVSNRVQLVPGIKLQTVPKEKFDLSVGAGYYMDSTVELFLGIRL